MRPRYSMRLTMAPPFEFPVSFVLRNICQITGSAFELKENPNRDLANRAALEWFKRSECLLQLKFSVC